MSLQTVEGGEGLCTVCFSAFLVVFNVYKFMLSSEYCEGTQSRLFTVLNVSLLRVRIHSKIIEGVLFCYFRCDGWRKLPNVQMCFKSATKWWDSSQQSPYFVTIYIFFTQQEQDSSLHLANKNNISRG